MSPMPDAAVEGHSPAQVATGKPGLRAKAVAAVAIACWGTMVIGGTAALWTYSMQPGHASKAAVTWPKNCPFSPAPDRYTLVMVVHPQCPCTRASLQELSHIMRYATKPVLAAVLVSRPEGTAPGFEKTDIWDRAAEIPGVQVQVDPRGLAASALGLSISGATSVYDANGHLLFSGGITSARGHVGDNSGADAIIAILSGQSVAVSHTSVYGCSLFAPDDTCEPTVSKRGAKCCN